ncbi:sigma-70 family RNA polymerase sigma factor [Nannocystis pusilla]|uniref:Sigma-70 family RNA polymerase sigma factor n=1 Tax=Nannocystis pusilla TaxID=889268 RepID=A0A9X3ESS3_9BACT|nr:sigma-70 family RNA polymerase sigma factor [Nannocystis pusilla]MCY1009548.1 sigma-70 family RNA polymerase sigma factor [Nannocystis pusilla]
MMSDVELLQAWRSGDRRAGNDLFKRHFDSIRRFFRNKVDFGVEDLVQRTFVACVEGQERFREDSSFRTYLFGIAHNILREFLRAKQRAPAPLDLEQTSAIDLGASPVSLLAQRSEEKLLLHALRRLPLASQIILELYYWEQMTGGELGVLLNVPEDTARSRLRKAKRQLEQLIQQLESDHENLHSTLSGLDRWAAGLRDQLAISR